MPTCCGSFCGLVFGSVLTGILPKYFSAKTNTCLASTSPVTTMVALLGAYHRSYQAKASAAVMFFKSSIQPTIGLR